MTNKSKEELSIRLNNLLQSMSFPNHKSKNIKWLRKCLGRDNSTHKHYEEVIQICDCLILNGWH